MHTSSHTPSCCSHVLGEAVFVGNTLVMPDAGTARAAFPGGDAGILYGSIQKIFALPEDYRIFMCHGYCTNGGALKHQTTLKVEHEENMHIVLRVSKAAFIDMAKTHDSTLSMLLSMLPSLHINMCVGHIPEPDQNGLSCLSIPINAFK